MTEKQKLMSNIKLIGFVFYDTNTYINLPNYMLEKLFNLWNK